ncbi:MAG: hypothetical protein DNFNHJIP_00403 [Candidatus Argoarchaeum ethanivorans]|uniref:Uncharacterized protein n=1 Tax=Candidatus Argoarchaeum ethanivorans TaxID=2608793 RepID=A0A812A0D8_9EURY|nr:MAG: hypothetical protein DNFNHJIP_00403 [Candidatus Argoarchaeum ethanivorans]
MNVVQLHNFVVQSHTCKAALCRKTLDYESTTKLRFVENNG